MGVEAISVSTMCSWVLVTRNRFVRSGVCACGEVLSKVVRLRMRRKKMPGERCKYGQG